MKPDERAFEEHIADSLVERGGYRKVKIGNASGDFDATRGLDLTEFFAFIGETQPEAWDRLAKLHGGEAKAREQFANRLVKELDARGTVDVLRHGLVDLGVTLRLAFFKPAHGLTPQLVGRYEANRLTVTRQLPYETGTNKTLDLVLFVNGLPVATAELKNALTGQDVEKAKAQYRKDRDPKNVTLGRRAVVHFAVDTEQAAMTTRLAGGSTRFLPFNRGHGLGKGNPPNPQGHRTAYLWERVWERDAWLDLLGRFVHVEKPGKGAKSGGAVIFPRYHQWDAVLSISDHARRHGAGKHYLVQHSAGSGKSNTIAWLAHRLSSLHNANNAKVFDKVVVITDRVVLDKQLQDTIYQFEHAHGVVRKIDESSTQLAETLAGESARIIITTLQKFPFILDKVSGLSSRSYAILVDEAHSSQTGETAKDLRKVLGSGPVGVGDLAAEGPEDYETGEAVTDPAEEALTREVEARGQQENISFFAFTATPKGRTLEMFGNYDEEVDHNVPFHLYSMRQAIEEGFIHDVLASYLTYATYWKIEKAVEEDPDYDPGKAGAAIARFITLHDYNLSQKAGIIVEHFREHIARKIGGKAKAMVVTSSRKHAVRMTLALRKYVYEHGYDGPGILVAFSGTVEDDGASYTEPQMNGFPEGQTPREFEEDDWRFLVVADKYQTGFDQPLLYAMYVDKVLTGLAAVQTLSRLNRRAEGKDGTFVLDFRNDAEAIRAEFEPYYGETVAPPTDPNLLYDTRRALDEYGVLRPEEIEKVAALLVSTDSGLNHARIHAALAPAIDRFYALEDDEQDAFRDVLDRFVRTYSFLSQVVRFADVGLERDYRFCRALSAFVRRDVGASLDLGSEVELTHLHFEQTFEGSVALESEQGVVTAIYGDGTGTQQEPEASPLSRIISKLNERFGLNLTEADRLHLDSIAQELADDATVQRQAAANTLGNFGVQFPQHFQKAVVERLTGAEDFSYKLLGDADMAEQVRQVYLPLVYGLAKVAWQEHCPIGDLLGPPPKEGPHLEYKSTFRTHASTGELFKLLQTASLKTIAAFLNSREGGTLLIGVSDDGLVFGLEGDYVTLRKEGKDDRDVFLLHLDQAVINAVGLAAAANISHDIREVGGRDLCRVHVKPSSFPVEAEVVEVDKNDQHIKKTVFYGRFGNGTRAIPDPSERERYKVQVWGN